ncbi:DNA-binding protein [Cyanobium sp. LEGE 06143]|uniref:PPC domain-containing DNA-binding protein n=1 Tax=Cyanobium sp. LEGE 06143 TaxID=945727 RepID=UPI00187EC1C8|nr:PPC domain-containing DNA-binding protein [Cyanobium sp. LEGE 06143]MBE9171571.1 DNA-binding protein [Cyanobium sp. LEGE 06143]
MCSRFGWIASSGIDPIQPRPPCPLLRLADRQESTTLDGALEIVSLAGTLSADGAHLHIAIADNTGAVIGGHLAPGSLVRTTAELLVGLLPHW